MLTNVRCELVKSAATGRFRVEIYDLDGDHRLYVGPFCKTPAIARRAALRGLAAKLMDFYLYASDVLREVVK